MLVTVGMQSVSGINRGMHIITGIALTLLRCGAEQNMGDVKLFNDNGKMANATQPLKMLKEAIALMATAEKDSKAAYDEIKKIAGKATQTKANLDKTIAKSQIGLQEVDKDGKASDETLKRFSVRHLPPGTTRRKVKMWSCDLERRRDASKAFNG